MSLYSTGQTSEGSPYSAQREGAEYQQYMQDKEHFEFSKDPFQAFFYLIALNMDVSSLASLTSTIHDAADQIEQLEWYVSQATKIKSDFVNGKTDPGADLQLKKDIQAFFQHMLPDNDNIFSYPDGSKINVHDFQNLIEALTTNLNNNQPDPAMSPATMLQIINVFMKGFDVVDGQNALLSGNTTLKDLWDSAQENPGIIQPYLNALSSIESTTKGISGIETTKMDYLQKQYMNVLAFLKSMFNNYYQESKAPIGKEET